MGRSACLWATGVWAFAALASVATPSRAVACKCAPGSVEQGKADAVAVFEGRVTAIDAAPAGDSGGEAKKRVTLALVRTWKGLEQRETAVVVTNGSSASCGYAFQVETSYLVYATGSEGDLQVSACSRTRPLSEAGEDLASLGAGVTPVEVRAAPQPPGPKPDPASSKPGGCAVGDARDADLALLPALAWGAWRLRRRRVLVRPA